MDILSAFTGGKDNNSKDIIFVILILIFVLGTGKDTGFNLFNTDNNRGSRHHHKKRDKSCSSPGG